MSVAAARKKSGRASSAPRRCGACRWWMNLFRKYPGQDVAWCYQHLVETSRQDGAGCPFFWRIGGG